MLPECPPDLRLILPYLQRAAELKAREPVVAYYCGFYAANLAVTKGYPKTAENDGYIVALLDELNEEKKELKDEPALHSDEQARAVLLQFAMRIFLAADNEDRSGSATKKTGRLFLVASQFLEVIRVLGELPEEIEERIKYAKWKAADIVRALNEGRSPLSGPPSKHATEGVHQERRQSTTSVSPPPPSVDTRHSPPTHEDQTSPASQKSHTDAILPSFSGQFSPPPAPSVPIASYPQPSSGKVTDPLAMSNAEKYARYAISAIQFDDVPTAIKNLEQALAILRPFNR